jgi:site-specific recombinase XerD
MGSYERYEKECERIRNENEKILTDFKKWLYHKGLSGRTINRHRSNVDFYINDFLLYQDAVEAANGAGDVGAFLGYWFIRKAMWASKAAIKENAASLKKFYEFMSETGKISDGTLEDLKVLIKEEMPTWLATMERYDDPDIEDMQEVWGI